MTPPVAGERCICESWRDENRDKQRMLNPECPRHGSPPAPGARKEGCGCVAVIRTKWRAVAAEIDSSGCKCQPVQTGKVERPSGNDSAVDVRTASEIPLQPDQSLPAAVPQVKVVLHKRGTRGEGWESCSWDEDERTKECIDFEGKPYEHADFVPATAVADAVRAERKQICDWIMSGDVKGDVCDNFKIVEGIRARSRDGG